MSGVIGIRDLRALFDSLTAQYEFLTENRNKLDADCAKLREYIDAQVQQIQSLNADFEKLQHEYVQRRAQLDRANLIDSEPRRPNPPLIAPPPLPPALDDSADQDWEIEQLADTVERPLAITLLAEIVDVSVICSTAFSPDGICLAIGSDKTVRVYNIDKDDFLFQTSLDDSGDRPTNHIRSIAWTEDNRRLLCGGEDGKVRLLSVPEGAVVRTIEVIKGEVFQLAVSNALQYFGAVSDDGALTLFRLSDCERIAKLPCDSDSRVVATSVAISPTGQHIAVGYSDWHLRIWDFKSARVLLSQRCHSMGIYAVRFLPKGSRIVTGSLDATVKIWAWNSGDTPSLDLLTTLEAHSSYVLSLAIDPTGDLIVSGSKDLSAIITSLSAGAMLYRVKGHSNSIISVSYNPKGEMFCTGSGDQTVKIWSVRPEDE
jgi:WD40 repeat protein